MVVNSVRKGWAEDSLFNSKREAYCVFWLLLVLEVTGFYGRIQRKDR